MNDKQWKKLFKMICGHNCPEQLKYIISVMMVEFEESITHQSVRMRQEYGETLFRYLENLTKE